MDDVTVGKILITRSRASITDSDESNAGFLKRFDQGGFGRVGERGFPDEKKSRMAGVGTGLDDEFSDVTSSSDYQNLTLLRHFVSSTTICW